MTDSDLDVVPLAGCPALEVGTMAEAVATLRSKDVGHSAVILAGAHRDPSPEGLSMTCVREFVGNMLTFSEGESHRTRRKVLNQLVRPAALDVFRDEVVGPQARTLLPRMVSGPGRDGRYRLDLVAFCDRVFLHFAAKFIGLVDVDSDARMQRLAECVTPLSNAVTSVFYQDRERIVAEALAAKERYLEEFYLPSLAAARGRAESESGQPPANFLQLVVAGAHPEYAEESRAVRESLALFVGAVASSTMAVVNTVADVHGWLAAHPADRARCTEYGFMFAALQESLRLNSPFSPYTFRMAVRDTTVAGRPVRAGQEVHVSIPRADRDPAVWGADAHRFDPHREVPSDQRRYGIAFGIGPHQCLGQRVVLGSDGTGGAHVRVLQLLFAAGIRPDPENPPRPIERVDSGGSYGDLDLPRWYDYPVVLDDWPLAQDGEPGDD